MAASNLNSDVFVEILSRLPAKSLIRFKSVKKSWRSLIDSQSFVKKHQAISRPDRSFFIVTLAETSTLYSRCVAREDYKHDVYINASPVSVNGIICLNMHEGNILLWNPSIRDCKVVPENPVTAISTSVMCVGFGYDIKTDDYKIVRVSEFLRERGDKPSRLVEVYSLKTNLWRGVDAVMEGQVYRGSCVEMFLNGVYYWLAWVAVDGKMCDFIIGFNISEEAFCKIELPDFLSYNRLIKGCVALNNSIGLVVYNQEELGEGKSFAIWVMNEYGLKKSWEKKFTVGPFPGFSISNPLNVWNNKKLLLSTSDDKVVQYDLESGEIEILNIHEVYSIIAVVDYTESLVSVSIKGGN